MDTFLLKLSIMLVPALMAITCHEVSHGYCAEKFGDNTARNMGRLTLNPLKHLDIIGTLMVFVIGIGWAKPVPVNFNNLRNPKRDMIWVALAGPGTNFILAILSALALRGLSALGRGGLAGPSTGFIIEPILLMLAFSIYINLMLAIFNLIPVPPLDGGRVMTGLLPVRQAIAFSRIEPYGMIIILALIFLPNFVPTFPSIFSYVILPMLDAGIQLLAGSDSIIVSKVTTFLLR
ncbi:MAG TPA: site-2 protease family protein [Geobacteraceae bacterium]|nr:site-2 protease family protein [Geobacteraceae bacterium]